MRLRNRRFLMLQGPHGPFFAELAAALRLEGASVLRGGVNAGDEAEWRGPGYLALRDAAGAAGAMERTGATDLLLYGEARPFHAGALEAARARGLRTHILEEGYLRPAWITYEREGSNGNSPAAGWPIAGMAEGPGGAPPCPAASWGALRHHVWHGAAYHLALLAGARRYPGHRPHRPVPLRIEAARALGAAAGLPFAMAWRQAAQARAIRRRPYDVLLLQLEHDSSLGPAAELAGHAALLERVMAGFAAAAPQEQRLVVKMHPLEARRLHVARLVRQIADRHGLQDRAAALPGGRLAPLLDGARAALTVTSTAGQQALWRGLPLFAFGRTVYSHPELLPCSDLAAFLADPRPPAPGAHARFSAFLLRSSQIAGSYYTAPGRRMAIAALVPRIAAERSAYDFEAAPLAAAAHKHLIPRSAFGHHVARKTARTAREAEERPGHEVESTEWLGQ
ncbi:capsule biosynthesis protein CapA [Mangrovicoccus sp. HB161399]|uniref:capsular polysaccharide export protein, LipB/KpsS family n=1 Tax=Mangrovicoccus sp. HB161399 TaxID=2720392 RepID=UPI001554C58A|nr:capsule biosynthesis protein CapA [Mangrovicoccus sp. HB161399]